MRSASTAIPLICLKMLVSGCAVLSTGKPEPNSSAICVIDNPIFFNPGDTEQTIQRIIEHDRRLACLCPEQYPELHKQMECPK